MTDEILFEHHGALGVIRFNRPKALNSLTLPMVEVLGPRLREWAEDPKVLAVMILGEGEKGFCAGGDIRALYDSGKAGTPYARTFFATEYQANLAVHEFPKPYVAIMDGITMGGGCGVSVHGSIRVATDRTVVAMPETGIGLIPDVGGSYFLSRLPGEIGMFMALTGYRLKAADCLYAGVGTHYVPNDKVPALIQDLQSAELTSTSKAPILRLISAHRGDPFPAPLEAHRDRIDRLFAGDSVEAIMAALEADGDDWAAQQLEIMKTKSPTSMKLTFRQLREGRHLSMAQGLAMEYRLVSRIMDGHDFFEGVRAVIIDKDNAPNWHPDTMEGVSTETVNRYFADLGAEEWVPKAG